MYSQVFPFNLLSLRPELFLSGLPPLQDEEEAAADDNDNIEEEIDDDEPSDTKNVPVNYKRVSDSSNPKIYSDDVNDMCLVKCKLCDKTLSHGSLRDHLLRSHNRKRKEFVTYEYERLIYYRCKICDAETLFTHAAVSQHVRVFHNLAFSEYKRNYNAFKGSPRTKPKVTRESVVPSTNGSDESTSNGPTPAANGPTPVASAVKQISFDDSLLAEHSALLPEHSALLPEHSALLRGAPSNFSPAPSNSLLQHLLSKQNTALQLLLQQNTALQDLSVSTKEDEDELGDDDDGNEDDDDDGDDDDQISPLELCDANLTEQPDLNGQEEEDGEDEMDYSDTDCDPNLFCEMSMEVTKDEDCNIETGTSFKYSNTNGDTHESSNQTQEEREDGEVRIVTDNLNEMCEFECLLCGTSLVESNLSKHLKEVHQENRKEGVTHKYKRLTYYKCKICDKEITFYFAALRDHMLSRHNMKMPEYKARFNAFSNEHHVSDNLKEMCLCKCNICHATLQHHKVKQHMKYKHNTSMKNLYSFIRQTYYRCKICLSEVLFSYDSIRNHLWNHHSLSLTDYKKSCQAFTGECEDSDDGSTSNSRASLPSPNTLNLPNKPELEISRVLPPMPKLKNFSHMVNPAAFFPSPVNHMNPAAFLSPFNLSKEQLAFLLLNSTKTFSDKLSDMTVCRCKVCGEEVLHHLLKKHMKRHNCSLTKAQYEYVKETYHRCKICQSALLFSFESIRRHVYQSHKLSLKEYRAQYNAFTEETSPEGVPEEEKVFSDDPKEMCICACKVCDEEHLHHLIMKHIRKKHGISSKDKYKFTKLTYYKCKVCEMDFPFSMLNISNHLIQNHKLTMTEYKRTYPAFSGVEMAPMPPREEEKERMFSDNLDERCICKCNVCGKEMFQDRLGKHSEVNHKSKTGNQGRNEFVLKTYHKCKVCQSELLFNLQGIRKHVRRAHDISMDDYKLTYSPFTGGKGVRKGRPSKKSETARKEREEERFMGHAMDDNELETRDDEVISDNEDPDFDPVKSKI